MATPRHAPTVKAPAEPKTRGHDPAVIAYTTRDDDHAAVRLAAIEHARAHGCAVILYAADAASAIAEPMPNEWASEGEEDRFADRLSPSDLEFLGQEPIATQVREARAGGVKAFGWLAREHGPAALVQYATEQGAHQIFVPADLEAGDFADPGIPIERVPVGRDA